MSKEKAIDSLSDAHVLALSLYASQRGRSWKAQLYVAWESAGSGAPDYTPALQQIRNQHGSELLSKLRTREILEAGAQVAAAWAEPDGPSGGSAAPDPSA